MLHPVGGSAATGMIEAAPTRHPVLSKLEGGDRRSIGRVAEVIADVEADPRLFPLLVRAMGAADACVAMRAADAVEKISARHPDYLYPFSDWLIGELAHSAQQEVRWHFAQICPRLNFSRAQRRQVVAILQSYLSDRSAIVKTFAMQALADLALADDSLRPLVLRHVRELTETGTPAMQARGRKLLKQFARDTAGEKSRDPGASQRRKPGQKKGAPQKRCARGVPLRRE